MYSKWSNKNIVWLGLTHDKVLMSMGSTTNGLHLQQDLNPPFNILVIKSFNFLLTLTDGGNPIFSVFILFKRDLVLPYSCHGKNPYKLVKHYTCWPDIKFNTIFNFFKNLRGHVKWSFDCCSLFLHILFIHYFTEPKVNDLGDIFMYQNIFRL